jgi:hypothetical protein
MVPAPKVQKRSPALPLNSMNGDAQKRNAAVRNRQSTAFRGFVGTGFADPRRQRSTDLEANRVGRPRLRSVDGPAPFNRTSGCIVSLFQCCFDTELSERIFDTI